MQRQATDWAGNIVALVIVITVNALANILPIAGKTTGEISGKYASLFTPAGFTFGIWSLIYAALIGNSRARSASARYNSAPPKLESYPSWPQTAQHSSGTTPFCSKTS